MDETTFISGTETSLVSAVTARRKVLRYRDRGEIKREKERERELYPRAEPMRIACDMIQRFFVPRKLVVVRENGARNSDRGTIERPM